MSPPTASQPNGHAGRAVISTERRAAIWNHQYRATIQSPLCGKWSTREDLISVAMGKGGLEYSVEELTEVMRGKKHKQSLGVDSDKVGGEWLYRFTMPGDGKDPDSEPPRPSAKPSKAKTTPRSPSPKKAASTGSTAKSKAKRNAPLRPRAKSPSSASKSPMPKVPKPSSTRKRRTESGTPDESHSKTRTKTGSTKKPRVSAKGGEDVAATKRRPSGEREERGGATGDAINAGGAAERGEGGGGWTCAVM